jgi:hypothetical protein
LFPWDAEVILLAADPFTSKQAEMRHAGKVINECFKTW